MAAFLPFVENAAANLFVQSVASGIANEIRSSVSRSRSRGRSRARAVSSPPFIERITNRLEGLIDEPGISQSKRRETVVDAYQSVSMCTLLEKNVTSILKDTADTLDGRETDVAVIKGFKVCMEVCNTNTNLPMYLNHAVVVLRDGTTIIIPDWFRAQGGDTRTNDFDPATLTGNELYCLPINADKYVVLKHMRKRIEPSQVVARGNDRKNIDYYMSVDRQFRWDDATQTPRKDIFLVTWASYFGRTAGTAAASGQNDTTETYDYSMRVVTYFDDSKNYVKPRS